MTNLISPDGGLWVWLVASIAIFALLAVLVVVLWIRDRRPPKMALGWLGTWVLLHAVPLLGVLCLLSILARPRSGLAAWRGNESKRSAQLTALAGFTVH